MHLVFSRFLELARFVINEFYPKFPNPDDKEDVCFWNHVYGLFGLTEIEMANLAKMFSGGKHFSVCKNDSFMDQMFSDAYGKLGKKCVCGKEYSGNVETYVRGDFVFLGYYPVEFRKGTDDYYASINSPEEFDQIDFMQKVPFAKGEFHATIIKDPALAEKFRKEGMKFFRPPKNQ